MAEELEDERRKWREGIQPVVWPTEEQYNNARTARQYDDDLFHFAVAGSGKSSLINALRGVMNDAEGSAATGIVETILEIGRYPDPRQDYPFVWYDIPGAGTLEIPRWEYFNQQGLFVFDCIIILWDNRFTDTDIAILDNCIRFRIPCFIIRSKSDVHIRSLADDMSALIEADENELEEEKERLLNSVTSKALEKYRTESRRSLDRNLQKAGLALHNEKLYLVNNRTLRKVVRGEGIRAKDQTIIDEAELIHDILEKAAERRCVPRKASDSSQVNEGVHRRV